MDTRQDEIISDEEIEILQELMNIAFGKAAADLAEVIDIHVILSVPYIKILQATELLDYIKDEIKDYNNINIIEQKFWGKFKGDALLLFPSGAGKKLLAILEHEEDTTYESDPIDILERETLMEVGNILIGACIGKMAELLRDVVTYTPPRIIVENFPHNAIPGKQYDPNNTAVILKTVFRFDEGDVNGFLFFVTSHESIKWLGEALHKFMEQYE